MLCYEKHRATGLKRFASPVQENPQIAMPTTHRPIEITDYALDAAPIKIPKGGVSPRKLSPTAGWSDHHVEAEVFNERIEIPVVVQQFIPALDASGCNHRMNGLANGHAELW